MRLSGGSGQGWGSDDSATSILHVDMDAFFAAVEVMRRPELAGTPVIVGGSGRSVVSTANYEARAFGVHSAMPMAVAIRRCPQATVIEPDHHEYARVSHQVMDILARFSEVVEQVSVDEAFLDVAGTRHLFGSAVAIGQQLRERVADELGLSCSVGVAATKFVAKIASAFAKPNGLLLIPANTTLAFLHTLPISALWGVGEKTRLRLGRYGIETVAQLAATPRQVVQQVVGKTVGSHLFELAWGRDPRRVEAMRPERSVGVERTLARDTASREQLASLLVPLAHDCARRLRARGLVGATVALKVKLSSFCVVSRSRSLAAPTDVGADILAVAADLLAKLDVSAGVRLIGVRVESLRAVSQVGRQPALAPGSRCQEPDRSVEQMLDQVRARFGSSAVRSASALSSPVEHPADPLSEAPACER